MGLDYLLMMKYIITESKLKEIILTIVEQQSKPIPIDLYKEPNAVEKYCKAVKVPKEIIDSKIPETISNFSKRIEKLTQNIISQYPETKPFKKKFDKILVKIRPLLDSIVVNSIYNKFGYGSYNPNDDAKKAVDIIYGEILSELQNYKLVADVLINKKNVKSIKQQMMNGINRYGNVVDIAVKLPSIISSLNIISKYSNQIPECKGVIVVVDESMNKLKPNEQYHPKVPIYTTKENKTVDIDNLISPYIPKLNQIIDSFV